MTGSDLFKLNESYSILIGNSSSNPAAYLIDNTTGKSVYSVSAYSSAVLSISGARLDDTHFVVQALTQTTLFAKIGTVNGTSISFGEQTNIISAVIGNAPVVALEADRIMSIFTSSSKLGIGISLVNGTTITQKQTYYLLVMLTLATSPQPASPTTTAETSACASAFPIPATATRARR